MNLKMDLKVQLCKSCLKDCGHKPKEFRQALEDLTGAQVEITDCLKVCPIRNIAMSVKDRDGSFRSVRTVAISPTPEGAAAEIESLIKRSKSP